MDKNEQLKIVIDKTKLNFDDVIAIFGYGSRIYGTARKNSDYDFIVVMNNKPNKQYSDKLININFYTAEEHQKRLNEHEISALECYFLPQSKVLFDRGHPHNIKPITFTFSLDLTKLRHALSAKSSNSWVKAHKKLTIEKDYDLDLGRKSLFHSMRIIDYGIQIATHGKIVDYGSCNDLFNEIMNCYTWDEMFVQYKERYNKLCSEFRIVAPK
jgi:predicted nucleotidyltransferase